MTDKDQHDTGRKREAGSREKDAKAQAEEREKKGDQPEPNAGIMSDVNPDPVPGHPNPVETPDAPADPNR